MSARMEAPGVDGGELSAREFTSLLDEVASSVDALRAFSTLLDLAVFHDGGALQSRDGGLTRLLDRHLHDIEEIGGELRRYRPTVEAALAIEADRPSGMTPEERIAEAMRTAAMADAMRPAWHDLDTIAARARVHKCDAARVMFVLTGEDHTGAAYRAWDGNMAEGLHSHLLMKLCWEGMGSGAMWGQVSTATGLGLEKVKEVLQAMLEYTPKRERIHLEPFGEIRAVARDEDTMRERVEKADADQRQRVEEQVVREVVQKRDDAVVDKMKRNHLARFLNTQVCPSLVLGEG